MFRQKNLRQKTIEERIEKLPPIFKQRIQNLSKTHPEILDLEILLCEQAVAIISYVEKRINDELSISSMTINEYKKTFPLREEMIIWQFFYHSYEYPKVSIFKFPGGTKIYPASPMLARLYFSGHSEDIVTLPAGIWLF